MEHDFDSRNNKEYQNNSMHNSKTNPVFMNQGSSMNDSNIIQDLSANAMKLNEQFVNSTKK